MAEITLAGQQWLGPALVVLVVGLGLIFWSYYRSPAYNWVRVTSALLKTLGLLALLGCILEPLWSSQRARPGANLFVICVDNSEGMQIKDRGQIHSRGEILRQLLVGEQHRWQPIIEENFQVRRYLFDSRPQATRDFSDLHFDGRASSLGTSVKTIAQRLETQPVAGILLFTDGNATDGLDSSVDVTGWPPIYPVISGEDTPIKDVAIQRVAVTQTAFEDAPVAVQVDVNTTGYASQSIVAQLFEVPADGRRVEAKPAPTTEESQVAKADGELVTFRFQVRPQRQGIIHYQLRVSARDALDQFAHPEKSTEATLANNTRTLVVDRGQGPYRILYVGGRPNWEYKFLNRALTEDTQVELVGLIRVARREPKFHFKGRAGEASNPLFRGFDGKTEDTERYDQPVLVRLNTRDDQELIGGFPKTAEDLYQYHAVIVDDLEADFFTAEQRALLQKFVSERGGGFLMLGGQESFQRGKYDRTPIAEMLPVYLDGTAPEQFLGNLHLLYTREGWLQPWMRLRSTEVEENSRLKDVPPFKVLNSVRSIKPGATVMAQVATDSGQRHPALVVQRFGHGRTAALLLGDLWHWGLSDEALQRDLAKGWRQLVRWLVADVPGRMTLQAETKKSDPTEPMQFQVRVRDKEFQPLDNASVTISVEPIGSRSSNTTTPATTETKEPRPGVIHLPAEPATTEPGLYEATYVARQTGGYYASATATNATGAQVGRAETGWTSDLAAEEFRSLRPNRALLEMLASRTKGEVIRADKLDDFAKGLTHRPVPVTETFTAPLWHQPLVFLFALACFVAEWGLRRWKGLA